MVERDLEKIQEFCQNFQKECLKPLREKADELNGLAGRITSALSGTDYATKIQDAVDQGEQRIREIEQRVQEQINKRKQLESEGR